MKKSIALTLPIIVCKYAILGVIIYQILETKNGFWRAYRAF